MSNTNNHCILSVEGAIHHVIKKNWSEHCILIIITSERKKFLLNKKLSRDSLNSNWAV